MHAVLAPRASVVGSHVWVRCTAASPVLTTTGITTGTAPPLASVICPLCQPCAVAVRPRTSSMAMKYEPAELPKS